MHLLKAECKRLECVFRLSLETFHHQLVICFPVIPGCSRKKAFFAIYPPYASVRIGLYIYVLQGYWMEEVILTSIEQKFKRRTHLQFCRNKRPSLFWNLVMVLRILFIQLYLNHPICEIFFQPNKCKCKVSFSSRQVF